MRERRPGFSDRVRLEREVLNCVNRLANARGCSELPRLTADAVGRWRRRAEEQVGREKAAAFACYLGSLGQTIDSHIGRSQDSFLENGATTPPRFRALLRTLDERVIELLA